MERPAPARTRNLAVLLPLLGLFLLMPPFITVFGGAARPWGVPLIVAYLFGAWAALLAAAAWLAHALRADDPGGEPGSRREGEPPA
jgi:hypothetical protein